MIMDFLKIVFAFLFGASYSDAPKKAKVIAKDGHCVSYENGIVYDKKAKIGWLAGPDKDVTWDEAKAWVESLSVEGGGWRMPTKEELKSLYKKGAGSRNMTPLLKTTGWLLWSDEPKGSEAVWFFNFYDGDYTRSPRESYSSPRVFAVRSQR